MARARRNKFDNNGQHKLQKSTTKQEAAFLEDEAEGKSNGLEDLIKTAASKEGTKEEKASAAKAAEHEAENHEAQEQTLSDEHAAHEDGPPHESPASLPGGGIGQYKSDPGALIYSVDRLPHLGTDHWGAGSDAAPVLRSPALDAIPSSGPADPGPITVSLTHFVGGYALGPNTVAESDPDGFFLRFALNGRQASAPVTVTFSLSGSAACGTDYDHCPQWQIYNSQGTLLSSSLLVDNLDGTFTLTIPAGERLLNIQVPVLSDPLHTNSTTTVHYCIDAATCGVSDPGRRNVDIVDTADAELSGWTPPSAHTPNGPLVHIALSDGTNVKLDGGGQPITASSTMENSAAPTHYQIYLTDRVSGNTYANPFSEPLEVTVKISGHNGLIPGVAGSAQPGDDMLLNFSGLAAYNPQYDPATGLLTLTLPASFNPATDPVIFSGTPVNDSILEGQNGHETLRLEIVSVRGNEALPDTAPCFTQVVEVPTIGITVEYAQYSESGPGMHFTVTLSSPLTEDVTVPLTWGGTATGTGANADYGAHPASVTIPAGQTSYTFNVPIVDDKLTETAETVTATVGNHAQSVYTVDPTAKTATTTIVDDTDFSSPGHGNGAALDGPILSLYVFDRTHGSALNTRDMDVREETATKPAADTDPTAPVSEITYRVMVQNPDGTSCASGQDMTVTLTLSNIGGATASSIAGQEDYYLNASSFAPGVFQSFNPATGELKVKIPAGSTHLDIPVKVNVDKLTETNRVSYSVDGEGNIVATPLLEDEGYTIAISSVTGNEASIHGTDNYVHTDILEEFIGTQVSLAKVNADNLREDQTATFKVSLSAATAEDVTVFVKVASGMDDVADRIFTVVIPKGSLDQTFPVTFVNDTLTEGTTSYTLEILKVQGGEAIINESKNSATGTIVDDMNGPRVGIEAVPDEIQGGEHQVSEHDGAAHYEITLSDATGYPGSGVPSQDMTVTLKLTAGTAAVASQTDADVTWPQDTNAFQFSDPRISVASISGDTVILNVPTGFDAGSFTFKVNITDDAFSENRENYSISISKVSQSEAVIDSAHKSVTTTIIDDTELAANDPAGANQYLDGPYVHLTGEVVVSESQGYAEYTLTLRDAQGNEVPAASVKQAVTVTLKYADGTTPGHIAESSKDYTELPANTTVTIGPNANKAIFKVPIADDSLSENWEEYSVSIDTVAGNEARIPADPAQSSVTTRIVDDTDWAYNDGHGNDHSSGQALDGPILTMTGTTSIAETSDSSKQNAVYQITLDKAGEEDMTVTLRFEGLTNGLTKEDIDLAALQSSGLIKPGSLVIIDETTFTFQVVIPKGNVSFDVKLPILQDDLTETNEKYKLSMIEATGSEGRIIPGSFDSVTTEILDDGSGPRLTLDAYDGTPGVWTTLPYFAPSEWTAGDPIEYRISLDKPASEDITVEIRIFDANGNTIIDPDRAPLGNDPDISFDPATGVYTITIRGSVDASGTPTGASEFLFHLPSKAGHYFMEMRQIDGKSESDINYDKNLVETRIDTGGTGPSNATYVRLIDVDANVDPDPITKVLEGTDAHFRLDIHNVSQTPDYSKSFDAALQLRFGTDVTFEDFNFADKSGGSWVSNANFTVTETATQVSGTGQGAYAGMSFVYDKGQNYVSIIVPVASGLTQVPFNVPIRGNDGFELTEAFSIWVDHIIPHSGTEIYFTGPSSHTLHIIDNEPLPGLTLEQTTPAAEGTTVTYTIKLPNGVDAETDITVELGFGPGGANPAAVNKDYVPMMLPVTIPAGSNSATFTVTLPENQYWQGNQDFTIWIDKVTGGYASIVTDAASPLTTTIVETLSGPTVYFPVSSMSYGEDAGDVELIVVFDRPAVEDSWVTIKIDPGTGAGAPVYGTDFTLAGAGTGIAAPGAGGYTKAELGALSDSLYYYQGTDGYYYILAKMPMGDVKATLQLDGFLIDNNLTAPDTTLSFSIVNARGGEVVIDTGNAGATLTILDVANGPAVNVTADKTEIYENGVGPDPGAPIADAGKVTYTFSLENGKLAEEDITITYRFVADSGRCDGLPTGTYTVTIPQNQNSITAFMNSLVNDKLDERNPKNAFHLEIVSVHGNEAHAGTLPPRVSIIDDDHAPAPVDDAVRVLVPPHPGTDHSWSFNVLANDTDADGDTLSLVPQQDVQGTYGTFHIEADGTVTYTLDHAKAAVANLTAGETLTEDVVIVTVTDGANPVQSRVTLSIKGGTDIDNAATTSAEWIFGTDGNDVINGKGGADIIHAGAGNDTITDPDGKGRLYGESGNDVFIISRGNNTTVTPDSLAYIDGGTGLDTIRFSGTGVTFDCTQAGWTKDNITGIEILDLGTGSTNSLLIDAASADKLNAGRDDTTAALRITGAAGNTFAFADGGWTCANPAAPVTFDGKSYYRFTNGGSEVLVQTTLTQNLNGMAGNDSVTLDDRLVTYRAGDGNDVIGVGLNSTVYGDAGDDVLILRDANGDGKITGADFAAIHGGAGTDTIRIDGSGQILDLTGITATGKIDGVEIIDITGSGDNRAILSGAALNAISPGQILRVTGNAGDAFELTGTGWNYGGTVTDSGTWYKYTNGTNTLYVATAMNRVVNGATGADTFNLPDPDAVIYGGNGNDTLHNGHVGQILYGDAGNDTFRLAGISGDGKITEADFGAIHGGAGNDTIAVAGTGQTLDLSGLSAGKIDGVEAITISGGNTLVLDQASLSALGETLITVNGGTTDTVELWGTWTLQNSPAGHSIYQDAAGKRVDIATAMTVELHGGDTGQTLAGGMENTRIHGGSGNDTLDGGTGGVNYLDGGAGDDIFVLHNTAGSAVIDGSDYSGLHGGNGTDTLRLSDLGLTLDLTGFSDSALSGFEVVELGDSNTLKLDMDAFLRTTADGSAGTSYTLTVTGDLGSTVHLADISSWNDNGGVTQNVGGTDYYTYTATHSDGVTQMTLLIQDILAVTG